MLGNRLNSFECLATRLTTIDVGGHRPYLPLISVGSGRLLEILAATLPHGVALEVFLRELNRSVDHDVVLEAGLGLKFHP